MKKNRILNCILGSLFLFSVSASGQNRGVFQISGSVVASGGQQAANGAFMVNVTIGQPSAGESSGGGFVTRGGFWTAVIPPTAAAASISGRILTFDGLGIKNVVISLRNAASGEVRAARTGPFGYYRFEQVSVGESYILKITSKRFEFSPDTLILFPTDDLADVNLTALPQK